MNNAIPHPGVPDAHVMWEAIRREVAQQAREEPILAGFLHATILNHDRLIDALTFHLAGKLEGPNLSAMLLREVMDEAFREPELELAVCVDIGAVRERDRGDRLALAEEAFIGAGVVVVVVEVILDVV